jgi:phosphosulfolactate synthase
MDFAVRRRAAGGGGSLDDGRPFIDRAKLAYGSSLLAERSTLVAVIELLGKAAVDVYPGGTLVEMALRAGRYADLLAWARDTGFTAIEICDGAIELPAAERRRAIEHAREAGFGVTTVVQEVVRKPLAEVVPLRERIERVREDLAAGATHCHIVFQAMMRGETPSDVVGPIKREQVRALVEVVGAVVPLSFDPDDRILAFDQAVGRRLPLKKKSGGQCLWNWHHRV